MKPLLYVFVLATVVSCKSKLAEVEEAAESRQPIAADVYKIQSVDNLPRQTFMIEGDADTELVGSAGTKVWIPKNTFVDANGDPEREKIASLAYSYWEARGFQGGSPDEDWLRAEEELRHKLATHSPHDPI